MKKLYVLFFILLTTSIFATDNQTTVLLSANKVKIGERFICETQLNGRNLEFMNELIQASSVLDIVSVKTEEIETGLKVQYECVLFEEGQHDSLYFTFPVRINNGNIIEYKSNKFSVEVVSLLTEDEKEAISKVNEPEKIELKDSIDIYKFRYYFGFYLLIFSVIICCSLIFLLIYKLLLKRKSKNSVSKVEDTRTPFERFISELEMLTLSTSERSEYELKLSMLSSVLKEYIDSVLNCQASSETTREIISSLRKAGIDSSIVQSISKLLTELDMIKFAKANVAVEKFSVYKEDSKEIALSLQRVVRTNEKEQT